MILNPSPKKTGRKTLAFFLLLLTLGSSTAPAQTLITVGISDNPPPVFQERKRNSPRGLCGHPQCHRHERELDAGICVWSVGRLPRQGQDGEIDLLTAIAYSPERDSWLDFSREAFAERWGVASPRPAPIHAMADLAGNGWPSPRETSTPVSSNRPPTPWDFRSHRSK